MSRVLIDLSVPILDGPSEATPVEVRLLSHRDAPAALGLRPEDFPEGEIVLIWSGADRLWGTEAYRTEFPGMTRESTAYLVERGVKIIGIDAWGFDRPFASMVGDYRRDGDNRTLWPAHLYGREKPYCQLEKLANLDVLPEATGFTVACFPVKLTGLGAGWTRVVAIVGES